MLLLNLSLKGALKNREISNIILFSVASCISLFGTSIYNFAIGLYILNYTGSGLNFAGTLAIGILSTILVNPFAGVLSDRLDRKLIAIITDIINGIILLSLYILTGVYHLNTFMIFLSIILLNISTTIYGVSIEASKSNLVYDNTLMSVNSINKVIESSSSILGPVVGGMVFAFLDIRVFIIINGFSFLASALFQLFIDFKLNYKVFHKEREAIDFARDIIEGINYLKTKKNIFSIFKVYIALNFCIGFSINVPMPYILNNVLQINSKFFGIIEAALPVGIILGAIIIKGIMKKFSYQMIIKSANSILSAVMIAIGISVILHYELTNEVFFLIYFILIMILAGIAISLIDIPVFYILQQTIQEEFRGRTISMAICVAKVMIPVALIIAGALINVVPTCILPITGGMALYIFSRKSYDDFVLVF